MEIIDTGLYKSADPNPLNGDAGLNCLNGNEANGYSNNGVILKFYWSGGPSVYDDGNGRPYNPNILYDNGPWRKVVPVGTENFLYFHEIVIIDETQFDNHISSHTSWLKKIFKPNWLEKEKLKIKDSLAKSKGKKIIVK